MMKRIFLLVLFVRSIEGGYRLVTRLVQEYRRPVTVFEYGDYRHLYAYRFASVLPRSSQAILAVTDDAALTEDLLRGHAVENVVVLAPGIIDANQFKRLGGCEHFDIAIIHNSYVSKISQGGPQQLLDAWTSLGDYILIEQPIAWRDAMLSDHKILTTAPGDKFGYEWVLYQVMRTTLERTRWSSSNKRRSFDEYIILSTPHEKKLIKNPGNFQSNWLPGINFITFMMLHGQLPNKKQLRASVKSFKKFAHNDLVIGNMLTQGGKLTAIDVGDPHRNFSQKKCIAAALGMLRWSDWQRHPEEAMQDYAQRLLSKK